MPDSIAVLPPGWRALNPSGTSKFLTDGVLSFYEANTTTPLEVFSDPDLTVSLGTSVSCNSQGYPISSGNSKVLIYTGSAPYRVTLTSAIYGGSIFDHPEVRGALDTSAFLTSAAAADKSVVAQSTDLTLTASHKGKIINWNPSAGSLTATITAASTLGDGWWVGLRHDGTANAVKVTGNGTDLFGLNGVNVTSFSLTGRGQVVYIVCNGTGFKIDGQVDALIGNTTGLILIEDRLSTPPDSPTPGARYLVTASPTGAWSTFAAHDIAEATGGGTWFKYTPPASCGWQAYVKDEDQFYSFRATAWVADGVLSSVQGLVIQNNASTPTTQIDIACDDAFIGLRTGALSLTINAATTGANGLDTGSLANNTWYHIWLISNGLTTAALLSLSATSPTMPSGYVYKYRIGAQKTGGSATFNRVIQRGKRAQYVVVTGSVTPNLPILFNSASGNVGTPTWTSLTVANVFVPGTAKEIDFIVTSTSSSGSQVTIMAPNNNYGAFGSLTNPPAFASQMQNDGGVHNQQGAFVLESAAIFYANSSATMVGACLGWTDAVNAC